MLTYDFEKKGGLSLYEYLYKCIKEDILSDKIKPDEKLPSKRVMSKNHNISIVTVENAYAQLLVEGYIYSVEKKGYFASNINDWYKLSTNVENKKIQNAEDKKVEKPKVKTIVDFSSNHLLYDNFPFNTWSKIMRQALMDEEKSFLVTPSRKGVKELREYIAKHLSEFRGMDISPDRIIVGAGTEYLYSLIVQLLGRKSIIALENPGYKKISAVYESNGVKCLHLPMDNEGISMRHLEKSNASAVHISPSHHFPTGKVMPVARRHQLLEWAQKEGKYIIEDDYDSEFRFSGRPIPTMVSIDSDLVIYMNTFSKTLAPSIRIAYMVLPEKLMKEFTERLGFYSSTVSSFEQYTLAKFIKQGYYERHINRMRNYYREYRNKIIIAIKNSPLYEKVTIEEENAGLHFILGIKEEIDDKKFIRTLEQKGIKLSCLTDYCFGENEKFKHKFIINYSGVKEAKISKALTIMNEVLKKQKTKKL